MSYSPHKLLRVGHKTTLIVVCDSKQPRVAHGGASLLRPKRATVVIRRVCLLTTEVLNSGATAAQVRNLADAIDTHNTITQAPREMVFTEKPSQLFDKNGNHATHF